MPATWRPNPPSSVNRPSAHSRDIPQHTELAFGHWPAPVALAPVIRLPKMRSGVEIARQPMLNIGSGSRLTYLSTPAKAPWSRACG